VVFCITLFYLLPEKELTPEITQGNSGLAGLEDLMGMDPNMASPGKWMSRRQSIRWEIHKIAGKKGLLLKKSMLYGFKQYWIIFLEG